MSRTRALVAMALLPLALTSVACSDTGGSELTSSPRQPTEAAPSTAAGGSSAAEGTSSSSGPSSGGSASSSGASTGGGSSAAVDDANPVSAPLPTELACALSRTVTVTVRNTGTTTWTAAGGYALGATSGADRLDTAGLVPLGAGDSVPPGATHDFALSLTAPLTVGASVPTAWRMLRGPSAFFGATASGSVAIGCDGGAALAGAAIVNSAPDTASWPVTTKITRLDIGAGGVAVTFDKKDGAARWPDVTPPGWDGPLQYTLWLAVYVGGRWTASGIIQFWYGLSESGGDVTQSAQIAKNWVYDGRWGAMQGHQPAPGEAVGFMVTAGNARGVTDGSQSPVRERSDMVMVPFPAAAGASFTF